MHEMAITQSVIQADPKNAEAHTILGEKYLLMRDLPNALAELKTAVDLNPGRVEGYAAVGSVYLAQGKPEEAEVEDAMAAAEKQVGGDKGPAFIAAKKTALANAATSPEPAINADEIHISDEEDL